MAYCQSLIKRIITQNLYLHNEMVQKRAARWVLNRLDCKDSVTEMLSPLKWKTLESRRTIARLSMLYKIRNRLVSHEDVLLQSTGHLCSNSLQRVLLHTIDNHKGFFFKYSFYLKTITEWNQLPREKALSTSLAVLKM